jgi:hypothetical protein
MGFLQRLLDLLGLGGRKVRTHGLAPAARGGGTER